MAVLKNHVGQSLRDDAAAAFDKAEADKGVLQVTSAARTKAQQQALIDRWGKGGAANRPPHLFQPAAPAETSNHVIGGGVAVDTPDWVRFGSYCEKYGFRHTYPGSDPVHFDYVGGGAIPAVSQLVKDRQSFLNAHRGEKLKVDGINGAGTQAATGRYQTYLKSRGWYSGKIDRVWGPGTQAGHVKYSAELAAAAPKPKPPAPQPKPGNPFGIGDVRGLQKIANLYGAGTGLDNAWGSKSAKGFAAFLRKSWGYKGNDSIGPVMWAAIARWLRARWGYKGNDLPGPVMRAALQRANTANWQQLK